MASRRSITWSSPINVGSEGALLSPMNSPAVTLPLSRASSYMISASRLAWSVARAFMGYMMMHLMPGR